MKTRTLQVGLGDRSYPIIIEDGLMTRVGEDLAERRIGTKYGIIGDDNVASLFGSTLMNSLQEAGLDANLFTFPQGEASKNLETFSDLLRQLARTGFDRGDALIALGGGVTGDLTGFVAASYMRGIPFIQIPTTLLSQVDSSVGGKTGVDIPEGKNLVGAFYQPRVVYIDTAVLTTLPLSEYTSGLAEVIKYGVIQDEEFFGFLERQVELILRLDRDTIQEMIHTCCKIKAEVVAGDERESDRRRILNFGHTIGHAVEATSDYSISHGEAVAMGMVAALRLAVRGGLCERQDGGRVATLIHNYGLPTEIPHQLDRDRIKNFLKSDKKTIGNRVFYVLPTRIGDVVITDDVRESLVDGVLEKR